MQIKYFCVVLLLTLSTPVFAQDRISADAFLDAVTGKTIRFVDLSSRQLIGTEEFLRRNLSAWARADGSCTYGTISIDDELLCFAYDDEAPGRRHCWMTFKLEERLFVVSPDQLSMQEAINTGTTSASCAEIPLS